MAVTNLTLKPYACDPSNSQGRLYPEQHNALRDSFQRDRDRIIHSGAFRKLMYKTQVFVYHEGDYFRTRLTHSLEVAQIARTLCRSLGLNEDLAEALSLAHDLGHTPFGHAGESGLCKVMTNRFDHNDQTLRILTKLEQHHAEFDGLNLTVETLEGLAKHNGPLTDKSWPETFANMQSQVDFKPSLYPSLEAQIAALSDDIAYDNHDLDDGLRAKFFDLEDLQELSLIRNAMTEIKIQYPTIELSRLPYEIIRHLIGMMVDDVLAETTRRLTALRPQTLEDIRQAGQTIVSFSEDLQKQEKELRDFLQNRMYKHEHIIAMATHGQKIVMDLFTFFYEDSTRLPAPWQDAAATDQKERIIADYLAGMTDRYAMAEHKRLFT